MDCDVFAFQNGACRCFDALKRGREAEQLFQFLKAFSRAGELIGNSLTADAQLVGNLREGQVVEFVHLVHTALAFRQKWAIKVVKPRKKNPAFQNLVSAHFSHPFQDARIISDSRKSVK